MVGLFIVLSAFTFGWLVCRFTIHERKPEPVKEVVPAQSTPDEVRATRLAESFGNWYKEDEPSN